MASKIYAGAQNPEILRTFWSICCNVFMVFVLGRMDAVMMYAIYYIISTGIEKFLPKST